MTLQVFFQLLVNGLAIGMLYVLIVLGLDIIIRVCNIFNFAHGHIYTLGAYIFWFIYVSLRLDPISALILSVVSMIVFGIITYLTIFNTLQKRFTPSVTFSHRLLLSAMLSIGLMMVIARGILILFGGDERGAHSIFPQMIDIAGVKLPLEKLIIILIAFATMGGLFLLIYKMKIGKALRAVSADAEVSSLLGVNTTRIGLVGYTLACVLAGIAGALVVPIYAVTSEMGSNVIFMSCIVMMMGGIGSYKGTILGGLIVGQMMSFGFQFIGGLCYLAIWVLFMVIIIFKPGGLLGEVLD
jgi:branched-chain amino acid transport system permease protein